MMGFLNKFMDSIGVELEQSVVSEVSARLGPDWSPGKAGTLLDHAAPERPSPTADALRTKLRLLPLTPAAIRFDRRWQRETPSRWPQLGAFLYERTGYDFPVLERLNSRRARRSIASMLQHNLDPATSVVGVELKLLIGAIFAEIVGDDCLADDVSALARHAGIDGERLRDAIAYARSDDTASPGASPNESASFALARAASFSPARIDDSTVDACEESGLSPAAVVEIITWMSVLQMLHRLTATSRSPTERGTENHHDGTTKPRLGVNRHRSTTGEGLRAGFRHHAHGRVESGVPLVHVGAGSDRPHRRRPVQGTQQGRRGPPWFNTPTVTVAEPGRVFAFNRSGPGMGSYTWRYHLEPTSTGTKLTESYDADPPVPKLMSWLTEKWVGSADRDADLHDGMATTLRRVKSRGREGLTHVRAERWASPQRRPVVRR